MRRLELPLVPRSNRASVTSMFLRSRWLQIVAAPAAAAALAMCHANQPASTPTSAPSASSAPAVGPSGPEVILMDASVVVNACPDAKTMNTKVARDAIRKLVDSCSSVPGGSSRFMATLKSDGTIELASPSGDPSEGLVPTCVLRHRLTHQVMLKNACKFDVQLVERPTKAALPDAGPG